MADKILAKYVQQALTKKSGEDKNVLKRVIGSSKMVIGPHYQSMTNQEIKQDVGQFNVWRNTKNKPMISPTTVKQMAEQMQSEFFSARAKERQTEFQKEEDKREHAANRLAKQGEGHTELEDRLRAKRQAEAKRLEKKKQDIKKKHFQEAIHEDVQHEVKDMAID